MNKSDGLKLRGSSKMLKFKANRETRSGELKVRDLQFVFKKFETKSERQKVKG